MAGGVALSVTVSVSTTVPAALGVKEVSARAALPNVPSPPSLPVNVHAWEAMLSPLSGSALALPTRLTDVPTSAVAGAVIAALGASLAGDGEGDDARQGRGAEAALNIEGVPLLGAARQRLGGRRPVV